MPAPNITEAPTPPLRTMTSSQFIAAAEAFVGWMAGAPDEFNALADYLEGLETGTLDEQLQAIAGLAPSANQVPMFTGLSTASLLTISAVAQTLLGQTTQALMRTTGLGMTANGSSLVSAADYAAMRALLLIGAQPVTFNFSAAGDASFYADVAMALTQQATSGTGSVSYEKSTAAAPTVFSATTSPITLEAGAWLRVTAASVTTRYAVHLKRTA